MPRYKLTIAYDGTDFCGWQRQLPPAGMDVPASKVMAPSSAAAAPADEPERPEGEPRARIVLRTVQEVVQRAVQDAAREPVELLGASRTDAGVHARGQVAAFTSAGWPVERGAEPLRRAINSQLPPDVLVTAVEAAHDSFNPIGDCVSKAYSYTLHASPDRPVFDRRFVHHVWTPLDADAMNAAAARIVGEHDFAAFAKAGHGRESTVRTVFDCRVVEETKGGEPDQARRLRIEVSGSGFLYNMVRIIAGTLVEVGRGRLTADSVAAAIASQDRRLAGPTLPPTGLCLEWVRYRKAEPPA